MDKKYIELFKNLAQATASSAEAVMDYDREKNDENGLKTATIMRDDYQNLTEKFNNENVVFTKADAAKLLVAAMIQTNQLQDKLNNLKKAMVGYQTDVIPKLQAILDTETDEAANDLANEKFIIQEEEEKEN